MLEDYKKHHEAVWPEMLEALRRHGWHNYSLFMRDDGLLFGYFETPERVEGSNQYQTFHSREFACDLFGPDFRLIGYFPNGNIEGKRTPFRIAMAQDVYVFQYR